MQFAFVNKLYILFIIHTLYCFRYFTLYIIIFSIKLSIIELFSNEYILNYITTCVEYRTSFGILYRSYESKILLCCKCLNSHGIVIPRGIKFCDNSIKIFIRINESVSIIRNESINYQICVYIKEMI